MAHPTRQVSSGSAEASDELVSQHDRFRFYFQVAMLGKNVELVNPVAVTRPGKTSPREPAWSSGGMTGSSAFHRGSGAAEPRYSSP